MQKLTSLHQKFNQQVTDPRRTTEGHFLHNLGDILMIAFLALISGVTSYRGFEAYAKDSENWLKKFLFLGKGIPDADTIRRCLERISHIELSNCLREWLGIDNLSVKTVAVDGKTIRGSGNDQHKAYHVLTAFETENYTSLEEVVIEEKKNEISGSNTLFKALDLEGVTVTVDAMLTQKENAEIITSKGGSYIFPIKENHPTLYKDVELYMYNSRKEGNLEVITTIDKAHGRVEEKCFRFETNLNWLEQKNEWKNLKGIGEMVKTTYKNSATTKETSYYLCSVNNVEDFAKIKVMHWRIEANLHGGLDVFLHEDACKVKKLNAPLNIHALRKTSLKLLHNCQEKTKSINNKYYTIHTIIHKCSWSRLNLMDVINGIPFK